MTRTGVSIRNIDLAGGSNMQPTPDQERPTLSLFWWRELPLGMTVEAPEELPFSDAALNQKRVEYAAEQRGGRDPALGAPMRAGPDGWPIGPPPVDKAGSSSGFAAFLDQLDAELLPSAETLTVIVCTRDRPDALDRCLAALSRQRSPAAEVIVVDNSAHRSAASICERYDVTLVQEDRPGLSHARNAGVARASTLLIAFTDDDVEPHPNWTGELVRGFDRHDVDALTGLVLPASLDTEAQRMFQLELGGFGGRFVPTLFDGGFFMAAQRRGPQVWRIGAGANMAFRRTVFDRVGLFDIRLGAGASGCSEDSELWYRILAMGGSCLYEPRAVVWHHHRPDWPELERQIKAYMRGHVSALVAQSDLFGHRGNIRRIFLQLPRYFVRTVSETAANGRRGRMRLLAAEMMGWASGLRYLAMPGWRRRTPPTLGSEGGRK